MAISHSVIQQGIFIARQTELQQPPRPSADGENERQEESIYIILAAPTKKRRLVDFLSTTNSPQEAMDIEERVKEELSCYLGYNQPEINSSLLKLYHNQDLLYISIIAKKYFSVCATSRTLERVFSTSINIVTGKHSCLKPSKIDKLVF